MKPRDGDEVKDQNAVRDRDVKDQAPGDSKLNPGEAPTEGDNIERSGNVDNRRDRMNRFGDDRKDRFGDERNDRDRFDDRKDRNDRPERNDRIPDERHERNDRPEDRDRFDERNERNDHRDRWSNRRRGGMDGRIGDRGNLETRGNLDARSNLDGRRPPPAQQRSPTPELVDPVLQVSIAIFKTTVEPRKYITNMFIIKNLPMWI